MGFLDFLRGIVDGVSRDIKWKRQLLISKKKLMYRFTVKQLKQIAEKEGVDVIGLSRKGEVVDALLYRIEFKKFVHYAKRYGVKYGDIIEELREFKKQLDSGKNKSKKVAKRTTKNQMKTNVGNKATPEETITNRIIKLISKFEPVTIARDEKELKVQLVQWLQAHFGKENVKIEYPFEHGKIDIVVNDEVAIEVKVALSKQSMKNLLGEVQTDKMYFSSVIAVIFDVGKNVGLEFFIKQIKALGVNAVIIPTKIKRRGKKKQIVINDGKRKIIVR